VENSKDRLREEILRLVAEYHAAAHAPAPFVPGSSPVPVAGRVYDAADLQSVVGSGLEFWLTAGPHAARFEKELAGYVGGR